MNQLHSCLPVLADCKDTINHMTFDGCFYYCTINCKCEIVRLSACLEPLCRHYVCREYDCICYDNVEDCFWASSRDCNYKLFKLNCDMSEAGCLSISQIDFHEAITGVSFDCCNNALLVSFPCIVVKVEKDSGKAVIVYSANREEITGVLGLCPGMLLSILREQRQFIEILDSEEKSIGSFCINNPYLLKNLLFNPCESDCPYPPIEVFALSKKNFEPYLCKWELSYEDLCFIPHDCNYQCKKCSGDSKPQPEHDPCADIMESIALIEAALAHILNAEGEKLQKILQETDDIEKILCVNHEIDKTIVQITHLEHVLHAKLTAIIDCRPCE